ncbi:MAG: hypothetical protein AAF363_12730 [Bacteroidota bacterium]
MKIIQPKPPGFEDQVHKFKFEVNTSNERVWRWLNDPDTFTKTQYWPYIVEFYSPEAGVASAGFQEGVITNHYGPFINFAGILTEIKPEEYRDLQYYYGSYAINFNWIRPYRLEFSTRIVEENRTEITGRICCYVKPWISGFWLSMQRRFWKRFQKWSSKSILKQ